MFDKLFESMSDLSIFQVVKLPMSSSAKDLSDELNNSSIQSDMTLMTQIYLPDTKELALLFVSNTKSRIESTGDLLREVIEMTGFDTPKEADRDYDLDDVEGWLEEDDKNE